MPHTAPLEEGEVITIASNVQLPFRSGNPPKPTESMDSSCSAFRTHASTASSAEHPAERFGYSDSRIGSENDQVESRKGEVMIIVYFLTCLYQ